jgi:hypothetical protein
MTVKDVAAETHLGWWTVRKLEMEYMQEQLRRVGSPAAKVIGIDEISIRKGHTYLIVVSDLERRRPLREKHGLVLRVAGTKEKQADTACRYGYEETFP